MMKYQSRRVLRVFKLTGYCLLIPLLALFLAVHPASATIINSGDIMGLTTFQDQNTGRIWLDLDNFFNKTFNDMKATAVAAGFAVANKSDVSQLLSSLPNPAANWASYTAIMGEAPNRDLIWGAYDDTPGDNSHDWAWAYSNESSWTYQANAWDNNTVPNGGSSSADMNLWAYRESTVVPLPASLLLFGPGLAAVAVLKRRIKK